jgi:hypothetical protein
MDLPENMPPDERKCGRCKWYGFKYRPEGGWAYCFKHKKWFPGQLNRDKNRPGSENADISNKGGQMESLFDKNPQIKFDHKKLAEFIQQTVDDALTLTVTTKTDHGEITTSMQSDGDITRDLVGAPDIPVEYIKDHDALFRVALKNRMQLIELLTKVLDIKGLISLV